MEEAAHLILALARHELFVSVVEAERTADERHQLQIRRLSRFRGDGQNDDLYRGVVFEDFTAELTKNKGFDFLLGSIHFVDDFAFDHKAEHWTGMDIDKIYYRYFEDSVSLAKSKLFDGIGHPDAIKLFGHKPSYSLTEYYESLAKELSNSGMYADQNSGAARRCPDTASLGMDAELLRILKKYNVQIIASSDAHCPEDVGYKIMELINCIANC